MPGAYEEVFTFDDSVNQFGIGSHAANNLRPGYWYTASFEWYHELRPYKYYWPAGRLPKFFISVQADTQMECGNSYSDYCFNTGDGTSGGTVAYARQFPVDFYTWRTPVYGGGG
jgi:hypothetical protein